MPYSGLGSGGGSFGSDGPPTSFAAALLLLVVIITVASLARHNTALSRELRLEICKNKYKLQAEILACAGG
jgi:hypothetical protein